MIRQAAVLYGDAPAVECEGRRLSFRGLDEATDRLGNALLGLGLRAGDRVAVLLPNGIECLLVYYALAKAGLVRVPLNARETEPEHRYKLSHSGARALVHAGAAGLPCEHSIDLEALERLLADGSPEPCAVDRGLEEPLRLGYTGGTTGKPKAVVLTTRGEIAEVSNFWIDLLPDVRPGDTMLHAAPIAHASGAFFLPHLLRGARSVIMPKFDPGRFLELAERERATATFAVPTMISMILDEAGAGHAKLSLRRFCYGAAPIAPTLLRRAIDCFGSVFAQVYGQAEAPMCITCLRPEDHDRVGSAGRPFTLVEARIVDEEDRPLPPGKVGEIVTRGTQLMAGYWNDPEATARAMRGGWLHTGDVGSTDEDGFFYILDRKNDMLISGGFNVYPREVEDVLMSLDGVREAAVVGLPDERWGDRVHAVVSGGPELDPETLLAACRDRIADYKRPRSIDVWDELPKSGAGKILRRAVRDVAVTRRTRGPSPSGGAA